MFVCRLSQIIAPNGRLSNSLDNREKSIPVRSLNCARNYQPKEPGPALTPTPEASSLLVMRLAQWVLSLTLAAALSVYGAHCVGMPKQEQAMQCCDTMRCHSHHHDNRHSQDCCKTSLHMDSALGQPPPTQGISHSLVAPGLQMFDDSQIVEFFVGSIWVHSHDPPKCLTPVASLRI